MIPNNNLGEKAFKRMLIKLFSEMHYSLAIHNEGTNNRFESCKTLHAFRKNSHDNDVLFH